MKTIRTPGSPDNVSLARALRIVWCGKLVWVVFALGAVTLLAAGILSGRLHNTGRAYIKGFAAGHKEAHSRMRSDVWSEATNPTKMGRNDAEGALLDLALDLAGPGCYSPDFSDKKGWCILEVELTQDDAGYQKAEVHHYSKMTRHQEVALEEDGVWYRSR